MTVLMGCRDYNIVGDLKKEKKKRKKTIRIEAFLPSTAAPAISLGARENVIELENWRLIDGEHCCTLTSVIKESSVYR